MAQPCPWLAAVPNSARSHIASLSAVPVGHDSEPVGSENHSVLRLQDADWHTSAGFNRRRHTSAGWRLHCGYEHTNSGVRASLNRVGRSACGTHVAASGKGACGGSFWRALVGAIVERSFVRLKISARKASFRGWHDTDRIHQAQRRSTSHCE